MPNISISNKLSSLSTRLRGSTVPIFSPASLFASGEEGAWFEPSPTTCFTDTAGTTPAQVGQAVALMLDKSKGLGPELVTNGTFDTDINGWTDASSAGGRIEWNSNGYIDLIVETGNAFARQQLTVTPNSRHELTFDVIQYVGAGNNIQVRVGTSAGGQQIFVLNITGTGPKKIAFTPTDSTVWLQFSEFTAGTATLDNVSVRELAGNHATQSITSARPILARVPASGRRNLLQRTEEFDASYWVTSFPVSRTPNVETSPDDTLTADLLVFEQSSNSRISKIVFGPGDYLASTDYTLSVWMKTQSGNDEPFRIGFFIGNSAEISITVTGQWQRFLVTASRPTNDNNFLVVMRSQLNNQGIYFWGAQLEVSSTATDYQRVGSTFDVTEAGQPDNFFLFNDLIDDVMNWTAPADDYSIARINAGATVTLLASQALSGATNLLNTARTGPYIAVDRALTTAEQDNVTAYLEGKGGGL